MSVMITGCAGFIGSHVTEEFLSHNIKVVGVDCMTYASDIANMGSFISEIDFHKLDINDYSEILNLVQKNKIEWIVNLAAETHVDNSIESCDSFIHSNINGVKTLLDVCRKTGCRLLQVSTDEVYGSCLEGSFSENDKLSPGNPYSATKTAAEHLITAYQNTYGIKYKMVRMSNNFGPRQHSEKFIPTILRSILSNRKVPIYGNGKNIRDWFFVKDCAAMVKDVYDLGELNETYNLTLSNEIENVTIVKKIFKIVEKDFDSNLEFVTDRLGHDFRYSIDNSKFQSLKNRNPTDFSTALKQTINYYLNKNVTKQ